MQLTFLLGNGFDKAIGLATGYRDFYEWYKEQPSHSSDIKRLKKSIQSYLDKENGNWADFECALGQFAETFSNPKRFMDCFSSARASLIEYITNIYRMAVEESDDFIQSAAFCLIKQAVNADKDLLSMDQRFFCLADQKEIVFNCISFKYTPLFDDGLSQLQINVQQRSGRDIDKLVLGDVLNVHGTLNDYPIFGVDNEMQIANDCFRKDRRITQMMVKGEIDKRLNRGWRKKATEIIKKSDKIYIYGASLGDTDEFWWKTIAQWFEKDPAGHQLAIYCHPTASAIELREKQTQFIEKIARHVADMGESKIVIDSIVKEMKVKFVSAQINANFNMQASATASVEQ